MAWDAVKKPKPGDAARTALSKRADELSLALESATDRALAGEKKVKELEVQLSDTRDEAEYDKQVLETELHNEVAHSLKLVHEVLAMLGKKAQQKHAARLREIRVAIARTS